RQRYGDDEGQDRPAAQLGAAAPGGGGMALGSLAGGPGDGQDIVVERRIVEQIRRGLRVGVDLGDVERPRFEPAMATAAAAQQLVMGVARQLVASCAGRT